MLTGSAGWQVKEAAMFIHITDTDDLICYGSTCSPVLLHFPRMETHELSCCDLRAAFSLLGSILHTLLCSAMQMFPET